MNQHADHHAQVPSGAGSIGATELPRLGAWLRKLTSSVLSRKRQIQPVLAGRPARRRSVISLQSEAEPQEQSGARSGRVHARSSAVSATYLAGTYATSGTYIS